MTEVKPPLNVVLLVDDDKITNLMHGRLIKRYGLADQVDVVTDGLAALEYLQARSDDDALWPDLILLDMNMPRMDGFEFLQEYAGLLDRVRPDPPCIIMVSTSVLRSDHDRVDADPNVHAFVAKPVQPDDLASFAATCAARRA